MKRVRLNYAYGIEKPRLRRRKVTESPGKLFGQIRKFFSSQFHCNPKDLMFAQNIVTHVVQIVRGVKKKHPDLQVLVDSHNVPWIKNTFETGVTHPDMTRPNYARLRHKKIEPTNVLAIDPKKLLADLPKLVNRKRPSVIVLSHVSRLTGEIFPVKKIYERLKQISPDSVLIVDGAQVAGAMKFDVTNSCDAYISVTSKFLGAEPNLAVAYLSPEMLSRHLENYPGLKQGEFVREAHSAIQAISHPVFEKDFETRIKNMREIAMEKLIGIKGVSIRRVKDQAPHIITLRVGNSQRTKQIVDELRKRGIDVFHNMNWSIIEPKTPLLRVSISAKTSRQEIEKFCRELSVVCGKANN